MGGDLGCAEGGRRSLCSPAELEAARRPPQAAPRAAPPPGPGAAAAAAVREAQAANGTQERPLLLRRRCRQPDPDRPHPLRGGPPEVSDSYSVSPPCLVLWGFLSPPRHPRPAQPSPAPTRRFDHKTALRWQLHPGFLLPLFQPSLGYFSAFWLPLLFSSALCPGGSPLPPSLLSQPPFPNYVVSQVGNSSHLGRLL